MKSQYFGDISDFRKYGLLRALQSVGDGTLLVAWMLTPDDGGNDGKYRSYLRMRETYERYDGELFGRLTELLRSTSEPCISLMQGSALLPRANFYTAIVPDPLAEREVWRSNLLRAASGVDLVFLDPDNGIEVPSRPIGWKRSSKYLAWPEIEALWNAGCSLLIYQHFTRVPCSELARQRISELKGHTGAQFVEAIRTKRVLFFLVAQHRHAAQMREGLSHLARSWSGEIDSMGFAKLPPKAA